MNKSHMVGFALGIILAEIIIMSATAYYNLASIDLYSDGSYDGVGLLICKPNTNQRKLKCFSYREILKSIPSDI